VRIALRDGAPVCAWADPAAAPHGLALAPLTGWSGHLAALAWGRRTESEEAPTIARFDFVASQG
jgi:hypothetical protein